MIRSAQRSMDVGILPLFLSSSGKLNQFQSEEFLSFRQSLMCCMNAHKPSSQLKFAILVYLVQSERLSVARVDDSDVQLLHPLEAGLQRLGVVDQRGNRRAGPVLEEVSAEERLLIGQNCGG